MALEDSPADCKAKAGAGILVLVEPLEQAEDALGILGVESNTVISNGNRPEFTVPGGCDRDLWAGAICLVLHRIREQVLKHLGDLSGISANNRKKRILYHRTRRLQSVLEDRFCFG